MTAANHATTALTHSPSPSPTSHLPGGDPTTLAPALLAEIAAGLGAAAAVDRSPEGSRRRSTYLIEAEHYEALIIAWPPGTGLHMHDVDTLIGLFDRLVDAGSTVIVIEHNLDVVSRADWVIDLGPGAGRDGGTVVFEGVPADLKASKSSLTGEFLRKR